MLYGAKNATVKLDSGEMDYIRFGTGKRVMIMIPGLGDALQTVKGTALPMALMYREFAKDFTVYAFSRKKDLPEGCTTREMARDQAEAMEALGIPKADVFGVSMGGMIAQYLAIDYPEKVNKLVLTVTSPKPNPVLTESIEEWMSLAKKNDHAAFLESNLRRIYSEEYYRKNKPLVPVLGLVTKPKSYDRLYVQGAACLTHDASEDLQRIRAETLVVGGEKDLALGGEASKEIAERIPGAKLFMYPQWGHGVYEEAKDFNSRIRAFLME